MEELQNDKDKEGKKIVPIVKEYDDKSKDTNIEFIITFSKGKLNELETNMTEYGCNGLEKILKLYSTSSITNMNLFNSEDKLRKYDFVSEIIDDYYEIRLKYYADRKEYLIKNLEKELLILSNKSKYIREVLDGSVDGDCYNQ